MKWCTAMGQTDKGVGGATSVAGVITNEVFSRAGADCIHRSWERCIDAGLNPDRPGLDRPHLSQQELRRAADRQSLLTTQARPVMAFLYRQIEDSGCIMLLSDETGYLLDSVGDMEFCTRAAQVALMPGACWAEDIRGTNAVGTALVEGKPVVVKGAEHFLNHHNFLSCAAAPLFDPGGKLLGVLDISCDSRIYHPHTFGLVRTTAQMIENRIFEASFRTRTKLRFHVSKDCGFVEGAIALSDDGRILGANQTGFALLGLRASDMGRLEFAALFDMSLPALIDLERRALGRPVTVHHPTGGNIFISLDQTRVAQPRHAPMPIAPAHDALQALDTGDKQVREAIARTRRVIGRQVPILIQGETGVGKDMFARAIHAAGPRRAGPYVAVNCAALPESLVESELFGHVGGSFTGARREGAAGRFREAHGGTLFLDEIGDMPLGMQAKLLRVLEDRKVVPLGGKAVDVDFHLVAATNSDLRERIAQRLFRADLYYRLSGFAVTLPPARQRSDLPILIANMVAQVHTAQTTDGAGAPHLSADLQAALMAYSWPGNLRQLAGLLRTACLMLQSGERVIDWQHLSQETIDELTAAPHAAPHLIPHATPQPAAANTLRSQADQLIEDAVRGAGGNMTLAARRLGISRNTLYRRLGMIERLPVTAGARTRM
jgi:transcriptional regulator of acetoin/glycerol metabolism